MEKPPLTHFAKLPNTTVEALADAGWEPLPLPPAWARREATAKAGATRLEAQFARLAGEGEFRSVHIQSPVVEIYNAFVFPFSASQHPVYAMEFVALRARPVVAVIDLAPLTSARAEASSWAWATLEDAKQRHPDWTPGTEAPTWYEDCRSGHDVYARPTAMEEFRVLANLHLAVCEGIAHRFEGHRRRHSPSFEHLVNDPEVQAYKDHHCAHSPGRAFMHKAFGEAWSEVFMAQALFGPAGAIKRPQKQAPMSATPTAWESSRCGGQRFARLGV